MAEVLNHFKTIKKGEVKREYNVLPISVNHSLAINGLISCCFYGHLIVMITKPDLFRVVTINVKKEE